MTQKSKLDFFYYKHNKLPIDVINYCQMSMHKILNVYKL